MMPRRSDEELVEALAEGDEDALRALVERYSASIYRFSVRYTGDESLAQDISQEVFLKLYRKARSYRPGMAFKTWLFTIVRNTSIDLAGSWAYRKVHSLDAPDSPVLLGADSQSLGHGDPNPEERYSAKETAQSVTKALLTLPETQRTAIILKYYEGIPIKEIAEIMKTTVSSVESLLVRAKRNLVKLLEL